MLASIDGSVLDRPETTTSNQGSTLADDVADAVRRHLDGDRSAMTEIVLRMTPLLTRIARGYRLSDYAVEDVVQNTFLALHLHVGRLRNLQTTVAWLVVVARHEALHTIRTDGRAMPVGDDAELDSRTDTHGPEQAMLADIARRVIRKNLARLPARSRDLLTLAFLADVRDYATISQLLDMPVGSIGPTRQRGLQRMRGLLESDDEWRTDLSA
jgi:RNA polymerase sigma factor (sigma-70 family)